MAHHTLYTGVFYHELEVRCRNIHYRTGNICCRVTRNAGGCGVTRDQASATNFRGVRNARPAGCGDLFIAVCTAKKRLKTVKARVPDS